MSLQDPTRLFAELGFAVFQRVKGRLFRPVGPTPAWWLQIDPRVTNDTSGFVLDDREPFLQSFLEEADEFWGSAGNTTRLNSAIWERSSAKDAPLFVQIMALKHGGDDLLVFQNVDATGSGWRAQLQAGRDSHLEWMRDIARRQQLEMELRSAYQTSEKLHQARTAFLANVSHELRTPLTSILGMVDMLQSSQLTDEQAEYGDTIQRSATALLRLVNDVLDISRFEIGTVELECGNVDLAEFCSHLTRDYTPAAQQKGLEFIVQLSDSAPQTICQDPLRLRQILNNLIDNGLRFTETGSVTVSMAAGPSQQDMLQIVVTDTGLGIAPEFQQVIFDSFTQVDSSPTRDYGGTGLGLAISNKLVSCLGGQLSLESTPGQGSRFLVFVPYRGPVPQVDDSKPAQISPEQMPTSLQSIRVLVAEDNAVNRKYIRYVIEQSEGEVVEADHGGEALERLREHDVDVDVVLMDCQMPVMDGLEVTAMIRNSERRTGGHLPIVAVTAHASQQEIERCITAGMDEHITKPFQPEELRAVVRRAASLKVDPLAGSLRNELTK